VLWRFEKSLPDVPSPLVYNGVVFLFRSGGIATTLNAWTGEVLKQARLTGALEDYYASPIGVDDKVYVASEHGKVVVLRAAGNWEVLAINEFDLDIYATPAIRRPNVHSNPKCSLCHWFVELVRKGRFPGGLSSAWHHRRHIGRSLTGKSHPRSLTLLHDCVEILSHCVI